VHSTRWSEIAAFGETLFGNKYVMIRSESAAGKAKGYVFRFDKRQNASFSLKTYNHYVDEGYRLYQLGQIPAAIESLTDAIAFNLNTQVTLAQNYNNRGLLYFSIREFHKALADFKKAIELEEKLATAHNNIAGVLLQLGDYEEAIYAASTALFYDPNTDDTNLNVAKRLLRQAELEG
jgi:tetratricopeptide (TPR) repeat protein